ncbi:S9 family peptidase [Myxococcota bacterium]|nr:S9 family peptidase [Myxococcota bacterium]
MATKVLWGVSSVLVSVLVACAGQRVVEDRRGVTPFARGVEFGQALVSPSGRYVAASAMVDAENRLAFFDAGTLQPINSVSFGFFRIHRMAWASDDTVVIELAQQAGPLAPPVLYGELLAIGVGDPSSRLVFGYRAGEKQTGSNIKKAQAIRAWGRILDPLPANPNELLVHSMSWPAEARTVSEPALHEVYAVDLRTAARRKLATGPGQVVRYFTDEKGALRLAVEEALSGELVAHAFEPSNASWKRLAQLAPIAAGVEPVGYSWAKQMAYVIAEDDKGPGLFGISLETGARTLISRDPGFDPEDVLFERATGSPVAIGYLADYPRWQVVQPSHPLGQMFKTLDGQFPGSHVEVTSVSLDEKTAVARVYSDRDPGAFVLWRAGGRGRPMFSVQRTIPAEAAAPMDAVQIPASDGLTLHAYLTKPLRPEPGKLPLVLLIHGGPHGVRDRWGFTSEAQLFANAGFAVLQVNYRGSDGFGSKFEKAGWKSWGTRIQDDLVDATKWAIAQGIADPSRICTFGGSFGGYSALQVVTRAPGLYRCAVGIAGVYDLPRMFEEGDVQTGTFGRAYLTRVLGSDVDTLRKMSPFHNLQAIDVPVLLVHGEDDARAPFSHAEDLAEALRAQGKQVETLFYAGEGHGFYNLQNRVELYQRALEFIETHTGTTPKATKTTPAAAR